jgi:hypothetical protein
VRFPDNVWLFWIIILLLKNSVKDGPVEKTAPLLAGSPKSVSRFTIFFGDLRQIAQKSGENLRMYENKNMRDR